MGDVVALHTVRIGEDGGRAALLVDGVVQSISPADSLAAGGYWAAMVPSERPRSALILGLGGGTLARLLQARFSHQAMRIVGVDNDTAVLDVATRAGWLPTHGVEVIVADVFDYVRTADGRFDYAAIDLFSGEDFIGRALNKPFLRRVRALLEPRGALVVNLFRDRHSARRVERIATVFEIQERRDIGGNVVVHARRRR